MAVVVINYNSSAFTIDCVASIRDHTSPEVSYRIIVVDNGSAAEDYGLLRAGLTEAPGLRLLRSERNLGFTGGNLLGVRHANAAFYLFLNNDCVLVNDNLLLLLSFMRQHERAALCIGQMYNADASPTHSFGYFPNLALALFGSGFVRLLRPAEYPPKRTAYVEPVEVPLVSGAAMFVRRSSYEEVGGFDPAYFLYCEEEDLAWRLRRARHGVYLVPAARFVHFSGGSTHRNWAIEREYFVSLLLFCGSITRRCTTMP